MRGSRARGLGPDFLTEDWWLGKDVRFLLREVERAGMGCDPKEFSLSAFTTGYTVTEDVVLCGVTFLTTGGSY